MSRKGFDKTVRYARKTGKSREISIENQTTGLHLGGRYTAGSTVSGSTVSLYKMQGFRWRGEHKSLPVPDGHSSVAVWH